jgi:hypothetical protein
MWDRQSGHSAHFVLDLERAAGGIRIACVLHRYHAIKCACGVRTAARPGIGVLSTVPGRSRDLLGDLRQAGVIHADETPWRQHGRLRWLWVVLSSSTAIFDIGSRSADEIRDLIGDAFLGWLISDGYAAYWSFKKRQRCLAHLLRKGIALASGLNPVAVSFGDWLLREMRGLIHTVAEGTGARLINPMLAWLKRACKLHRDDDAEKVRALAREILNDWTAITAFVTNPDLPATNNEAERALRDAVIARRISNGTHTKEGSAAYAATLSVFETCRRRGIEPWRYITDLLAMARRPAPYLHPAFSLTGRVNGYAPSGRLNARAVWPDLLPRDPPRRSASPGVVVEEGQKALQQGRPNSLREAYFLQFGKAALGDLAGQQGTCHFPVD